MNKYQESLNTIKRCCEDRDGCYCSSIERLQELIYHCEALEKQFADQHNTDEFQHFKLHSDSTLKSLKKDELISYIKMVYHNWDVCDENLKNIADNITILDDALTRACRRIEYENKGGKMDKGPKCPATVCAYAPNCCNEGFCNGSNAECWKEWCMHMSKWENRN